MIEFDLVVRRYGRTVAVNGLTLAIPRGELFALLGPNGAGKTTAIRMLVGLLRPDSGHVRVCGVDCSRRPREASSHLGYLPDEPYLYEKLSGREILEFAAEMHGLEGAAARDRIARETQRFELAGFIDSLTETYSHGMRQRLVFALALLHDPQVLVVDEPMVGLDPHSARVVKDLLRAEAEAGKTVLMSTHTLAVAEEIADRIGILNRGELDFLGTLAELRQELAAPHQALEHLFLELTNGQGHGVPSTPGRGSAEELPS
jgi:ABC-2 type transport system ATP-binding protein